MRGGHLSDKCGTLVSGTAPLLFDGAEKTRLLCTPYVDLSSGGNLRFTIKHGRCKSYILLVRVHLYLSKRDDDVASNGFIENPICC